MSSVTLQPTLPIWIKIFDKKLLFPKDAPVPTDKANPIFPSFNNQTSIEFCLIQGGEEVKTWFKVYDNAEFGKNEIEFRLTEKKLGVSVYNAKITKIDDIHEYFKGLYDHKSYWEILGIKEGSDLSDISRARDLRLKIFSEEEDLHKYIISAHQRLKEWKPSDKSTKPPEAIPEVKLGFFEKMIGLILSPSRTFNELKSSTLGDAFMYFLPLLVIYSILSSFTMGLASTHFIETIFIIFILWIVTHIFAYIVGGRNGIVQTLKAVVYGYTPILLLGWIPIVFFISYIWSLILIIYGVKQLHSLS